MFLSTISTLIKFPIFLLLSALNLSFFKSIIQFISDLTNKKVLTQYNAVLDPVRPTLRLLNEFCTQNIGKIEVDFDDIMIGALIVALIWQASGSGRVNRSSYPAPLVQQGGVKRPDASSASSGSSSAK